MMTTNDPERTRYADDDGHSTKRSQAKIRALLTADQKTKFDACQADRGSAGRTQVADKVGHLHHRSSNTVIRSRRCTRLAGEELSSGLLASVALLQAPAAVTMKTVTTALRNCLPSVPADPGERVAKE